MKKNAEVRRYSSFADDFVRTKDQDHRLPEDYRWIRTDVRSRFLSALSYGAALVISSVWCRAALHVRLRDRKLLRAARDGAFIAAEEAGERKTHIGDKQAVVQTADALGVVFDARHGLHARIGQQIGNIRIKETKLVQHPLPRLQAGNSGDQYSNSP